MINTFLVSLGFAVGVGVSTWPARAESEALLCRQSHALFAAHGSASSLQYAPSREIDILHLALDVTPHFKERTVDGTVILTFKPIAKPFQELKLDAVDLTVSAVRSTAKVSGYQVTADQVVITFEQPIPPDQEASVTIVYSAEPTQGLYFRTPEMGYKAGDTHLWTQGEPTEARHWYPCYDSPNEKFTSEVACRVPEGMVVLSNGRLVSQEKEAASGLVLVRWSQEKPHTTYLISLLAGYFKKVEDKYRDIPLAFYTPASQIAQAASSFQDTKDMMAFFEKEIGVPYPWAKYAQVCVDDFGWGGMENTSITTLNDRTLHTPETENLRSSQELVAHELAHQWFGDLVTCKDWSHVWLNEGFATYYEALYDGHKNGRDSMLYGLYQSAKHIVSQPNQANAIVRRDFQDPEEQFSFLAYQKGSWVLHMLRSQLGEELYRRCIKTHLERHQFDNAVTGDLNAVIEELSGRSFDQFFDQWVYHAGQPELAVSYAWDQRSRLAKLNLRQTQKLSGDVLLFNFPLTIRFQSKGGPIDRQIIVKEKEEDFYFPLPEAPDQVRIDPNLTVLARISFDVPKAMLHAQLADRSDLVGRLMAAEELGKRKDSEALAKLKEALNKDPFYGVRVAASKGLRAMQSDEALEALLASSAQSDARARHQVVEDIGGYYRESSYAALQKILQTEKNPDIQAEAITGLGAYQKPELRPQLIAFLNSDSYRSVLADAAIGALRAQDDPAYLGPLLDSLQKREPELTTGVFTRGLENLAYLARHEEKKDAVREFVVAHVNSPKKRLKLAAIAALGSLGDPQAIALLEKFTGAPKGTPERTAAEKALASLRDSRKPSAEFGSLRSEVLGLQKENRELRTEMDALKKKVDAVSVPPQAVSVPPKEAPAKTSKPLKPLPARR